MAEPFETLREVGVALDGFRADVTGQFSTLKWIIGAVTAVAIGATAAIFNKIDKLEDASARNTAILERIEDQLALITADTTAIRENVQTASAEPTSESFRGWVGVEAPVNPDGSLEAGSEFKAVIEEIGPPTNGWIYFPKD